MKNPILEQLVYKIRDSKTDSAQFRNNVEEIGMHLGIGIARTMQTKKMEITSVLGKEASHEIIDENPVLIGILRAGIPLYNGLQRAFPEAEAGFIGAMRDETTLKAEISYLAIPEIKDRAVILADTMIATGGSVIDSINLLREYKPSEIRVAGAIASEKGIAQIRKSFLDVRINVAAIDPILNEKGYIVPGLGDAGDRAYGEKI